MFELLAAAFEDGWAFVKCEREILLVRPPYHRSQGISKVPESTIEKAVHAYGFTVTKKSFPDWPSLIAFLRERLVETRRAHGRATPQTETILELVDYAPRDILENYLDRIESELLPNREWDAVFTLLTKLISVEAIKNDSLLFDRTVNLLKKCQKLKKQTETEKRLLINENDELTQQFPNAVKRYPIDALIQITTQVWQRHQVMALGT